MTGILAQSAAASESFVSWQQINITQLIAIGVLVWGILRFFGRRLFRDAVLDILQNRQTQEAVGNAVLAALELPAIRPRHRRELENIFERELTAAADGRREISEIRADLDETSEMNDRLMGLLNTQAQSLAVLPNIQRELESNSAEVHDVKEQLIGVREMASTMSRELGEIGGYLKGLRDQRERQTAYASADKRHEDRGPLARGSG